MLRIITLNLNGIRSAWRKGLLPWAAAQNADIICLQELKAQHADLTAEFVPLKGALVKMRGGSTLRLGKLTQ